MLTTFDKYFLNLPPLDRDVEFTSFWKESISELKKIPMEAQTKISITHTKKNFKVHEISFKSIAKVTINGLLYIPENTQKPKPILVIHDYNKQDSFSAHNLDSSFAYLFMKLRGHHLIETKKNDDKKRTQVSSPNFLAENIVDKNKYYLRSVYLDALRSIDFLRLTKNIDCESVGIIGKGLGAACALFAAAYSNRIKVAILQAPALSYLPYYLNHAKSEIADEIIGAISMQGTKKSEVKESLKFFDILNFSDMIDKPVVFSTGLKDTVAPPTCGFSLFNHICAEKTCEVFPDDGNDCGGSEMWKKAIGYFKEYLTV